MCEEKCDYFPFLFWMPTSSASWLFCQKNWNKAVEAKLEAFKAMYTWAALHYPPLPLPPDPFLKKKNHKKQHLKNSKKQHKKTRDPVRMKTVYSIFT